jgi:SAM-dependent methyltransferase
MSSVCGRTYPIVRGTPILIVEDRSVFRLSDYRPSESISLGYQPRGSIVSFLMPWVPSITENRVGEGLYIELLAHLRQLPGSAPKRVLIVGAGDAGAGIQPLRDAADIAVLETDVYFAGTVAVIADGHDLPFADGSFDAVVLQAVLEHVADPVRCVAEAHRVLRDSGLVYAESPFMYPVRLGAYDFQRFSVMGHRRLFRQFREIRVGVIAGAGTALALSFRSFLLSLSAGRAYQAAVRMGAPFFVFWLKYVDRITVAKTHASDFACTSYFLGRRSTEPRSDAEILACYRKAS